MHSKKHKKMVDQLFQEQHDYEVISLKAKLTTEKKKVASLLKALEKSRQLWSSTYKPIKVKKKRRNSNRFLIRIAAGDLHGADQDVAARNAFLSDVKSINPDQIVLLGDLVNCSGTFSKWHRVHVSEFSYNYENDIAAGNDFLDCLQSVAPNADIYALEGNHEYRIDKWASSSFEEKYLAELAIKTFGVQNALHLEQRGIHFFKSSECHMGLYKPGLIKLGKCYFIHGSRTGTHVSYKMLHDYGVNIVHGHNHREQSYTIRSAKDPALKASCPGCLCILQQYYNHEKPTDHTHGYTLQLEDRKTQWFFSSNIAIINGQSMFKFVNIK